MRLLGNFIPLSVSAAPFSDLCATDATIASKLVFAKMFLLTFLSSNATGAKTSCAGVSDIEKGKIFFAACSLTIELGITMLWIETFKIQKAIKKAISKKLPLTKDIVTLSHILNVSRLYFRHVPFGSLFSRQKFIKLNCLQEGAIS